MTQTTYDAIETGELDVEELRDVARYWRDLFFKRDKELNELKASAVFDEFYMNVHKLDWKKGDTIVISAPDMITDQIAKRLTEYIEQHLPGTKAMILADGLNIQVLREEKS